VTKPRSRDKQARSKTGGAPKHAKKDAPRGSAVAPPDRPRLGVEIDGVELSDQEARSMWNAFSAHMDEHVGDMDGFAKANGFASARPEHRAGRAILILAR
jgi:hypothetical protein